MNPNRGEQVNFELPPQPTMPETGEQSVEKAVEAPAAAPETAGKKAVQPVAMPPLADNIPAAGQPVIATPTQDLTNPAPHVGHASASDSDRIEPVWINKVKDVVARTHDDPHIQSSEMSKIKAEYNLKRFNKQIKTDEAAA